MIMIPQNCQNSDVFPGKCYRSFRMIRVIILHSLGKIKVFVRLHACHASRNYHYHQTSYKRLTKSQNLNVSRLVLQLSLPSPGFKSRMKMQLEQRRQPMLQLHLSDQQFYCLLRSPSYKIFDGSNFSAITINTQQCTIYI